MKNSFISEFKEREYFNQCTNSDELDNLMKTKKINGYIGFDCTAQSLHVGSLLQIMCLRMLQRYGHRPIVLLGGGTTMIGDPSGKEETRKILSNKEVIEFANQPIISTIPTNSIGKFITFLIFINICFAVFTVFIREVLNQIRN